MFKCRGWVAGAACLGLLAVSEAAWAFGFRVDPSRVEVSLDRGTRRGKTLTVHNDREESLHIKTYLADVLFLPDGTNNFPPAGSTEWSCASWVQVVPSELEIPAKTSQNIRVSVIAPPDAQGGHYAMLFFETVAPPAKQGIGINFRIGAFVETTISGTEEYAMKLSDMAVTPPATLTIKLFNEGNVLVRPEGKLKILTEAGEKLREQDFNPNHVGVLPKTLRSFVISLKEPLQAGRYLLRTEIDYGARTLLVGEHPFTIS